MAIRVLIADDALFMREMIKEIIQQEGYEVVGEAANGSEAVSKHRELKPDITTMDHQFGSIVDRLAGQRRAEEIDHAGLGSQC